MTASPMHGVADRAAAFRALHQRPGAFVIPNPWDVGSARLLAYLGFEALATSSAGYAFSIGQTDGTVGRERMLDHVGAIVAATALPVSADLENGFGDTPAACAETIRLAAATGLAGGSIEDFSGGAAAAIYPLGINCNLVIDLIIGFLHNGVKSARSIWGTISSHAIKEAVFVVLCLRVRLSVSQPM